MEHIVNAVVLRRRDSGESDRRLTLLTEEDGKLDAIAKGARKAASRLSGCSEPLSMAQMNLAKGKANRFITQGQPVATLRGLRTDYERLSIGLALCELYAAVLPYEQPFPEAFVLLVQSLTYLESHPKPVVAAVWAEVKLLEITGFSPSFHECVVSGAEIAEADPYVSPIAGGYVVAERAFRYMDRFKTRAEVLYGLSRIGELERPPGNLKYSEEALATLLPFWRHIAEAPLPANDSIVAEISHR